MLNKCLKCCNTILCFCDTFCGVVCLHVRENLKIEILKITLKKKICHKMENEREDLSFTTLGNAGGSSDGHYITVPSVRIHIQIRFTLWKKLFFYIPNYFLLNFKGSSIFSRRRWWTWWRRNWNWWTQRTRSLFAHCKCSQNYEKSHSYPSNFKLFLFGIFFELLWNFSKKNKNNIFCREKLPKMRANVSKNVFQSLFHLSHQKPQTDVRYLNVF